MTLTFGSLFAGVGGLDLGLERAGLRCAWQVEIDDYARRVLAKHWPDVRRHDDVRTFPPGSPGDWRCDLIAGGFPCQDISNAGRRAGIGGERSGLWSEFARVIRLVRPRFVLVENVDALALRGLDRVLGDLAALGFDAEWDRIPAAAVGAPHLRWRLFILAYAQGQCRQLWSPEEGRPGRLASGRDEDVSDPQGRWAGQRWRDKFKAYCEGQRDLFWPQAEPPVCGVADGVPRRVDRLRALGNAVVPQVAEWIGRRILEVTP